MYLDIGLLNIYQQAREFVIFSLGYGRVWFPTVGDDLPLSVRVVRYEQRQRVRADRRKRKIQKTSPLSASNAGGMPILISCIDIRSLWKKSIFMYKSRDTCVDCSIHHQ